MVCRGHVYHKSTCGNMLRPRKIKELVLPHLQHVWKHQECAPVSNYPNIQKYLFLHDLVFIMKEAAAALEDSEKYKLSRDRRPGRNHSSKHTAGSCSEETNVPLTTLSTAGLCSWPLAASARLSECKPESCEARLGQWCSPYAHNKSNCNIQLLQKTELGSMAPRNGSPALVKFTRTISR